MGSRNDERRHSLVGNAVEREGDFVLFGPGVAHAYRSVEESPILTVRWPSLPA